MAGLAFLNRVPLFPDILAVFVNVMTLCAGHIIIFCMHGMLKRNRAFSFVLVHMVIKFYKIWNFLGHKPACEGLYFDRYYRAL